MPLSRQKSAVSARSQLSAPFSAPPTVSRLLTPHYRCTHLVRDVHVNVFVEKKIASLVIKHVF